MFNILDDLPVDLVSNNVMNLLEIKDIVILERACGSKASYQHFMNMIPFCPPIELPLKKHSDISTLNWFARRNCKLHSLRIVIPDNNHIQNLRIARLDLYLQSIITINHFKYVFQNHIIG